MLVGAESGAFTATAVASDGSTARRVAQVAMGRCVWSAAKSPASRWARYPRLDPNSPVVGSSAAIVGSDERRRVRLREDDRGRQRQERCVRRPGGERQPCEWADSGRGERAPLTRVSRGARPRGARGAALRRADRAAQAGLEVTAGCVREAPGWTVGVGSGVAAARMPCAYPRFS
jgi:hypothetical protein